MLGGCLSCTLSKTQSNIALSSAEAELYAMVHGASEGLGAQAMAKDFGLELRPHLFVDASAEVEFVVANRIGLNTKQIVDLNISNTGVTVKITRCGKEQSGEVCVAGTQGEGDIASIGILKRVQDGFSTRDIVKNGQARGLLIVDMQQLQRKCHGNALIWGSPKVITNGGIPR